MTTENEIILLPLIVVLIGMFTIRLEVSDLDKKNESPEKTTDK